MIDTRDGSRQGRSAIDDGKELQTDFENGLQDNCTRAALKGSVFVLTNRLARVRVSQWHKYESTKAGLAAVEGERGIARTRKRKRKRK